MGVLEGVLVLPNLPRGGLVGGEEERGALHPHMTPLRFVHGEAKYHVRIVNGLRNHFPNTMFGGVLLWTPIEVLLRNMCSLYALWRQKTPLTNGQVQEAKSHCHKIGEAWLKLGWKSTPWVHWTVAHCGAVLQKHRNLYVFSSIPA